MTTSEEPLDLAAIQARADAAAPGPWLVHRDGILAGVASTQGYVAEPPLTWTDAEFIAHAREDIPALLARVRALVAERDEAQAKLAAVRATLDTYDQSDEDEEWRETAPEDNWRLYRDLDAILVQPDDEAASE